VIAAKLSHHPAAATAKLVWHGHADQVADLAQESIRDIGQLPGLPAPHDSS
jgi:hypothetical protein